MHKFRAYITKAKLKGVTVASVEEFQGQEKLIVMISTVRSRAEFIPTDYQFGIGFLRNPKVCCISVTNV